MKKRFLAVLFACILLVAVLFAFASCGEDADPIAPPTGDGSGNTPPNNGSGEKDPESSDPCAKGHTEVIDPAVAATCLEKGLTEGKHCSVCNTVLVAQTEIAATGHHYVKRICTGCGDILYSRGLEFVADDNGTCYVKSLGVCTDLDVYIPPKSPEGRIVTKIADEAFSGCTDLTSMLIPDSVTRVGQDAFKGCTNLIQLENGVSYVDQWAVDLEFEISSVTLRENTVGISDFAFYGSYNLTELKLPEGLRSLGRCSLAFCNGLTALRIPESLTVLEDSALHSSRSFFFNEYDNACYLGNEKNPYMILVKAKSTEIASCNIHESTKFIHSSAFDTCRALKSIKIPGSVISVGSFAFIACYDLADVTISEGVQELRGEVFVYSLLSSINLPKSLVKLSPSAFTSCNNLVDLTVAEGNPRYYSNYNCVIEKATKTLIIGCSASVIPTDGSVTAIGNSAFSGCRLLKSITIPNSVTRVGAGAFGGCYGLTTIEFPNSITELGDGVLASCSNLKSVVLPNRITRLGENALEGCTNLAAVTIPDTVTSIGPRAFAACKALKTIVIPSGVTHIAEETFSYCESLESVILPSGITGIGDTAFEMCISLKSITIPRGVTDIADFAFTRCYALESITLPETLTRIGNSAFYECRSLKAITIPEQVTSIGEHAFFCCQSLESINIPNGVTSIQKYAFYSCGALTEITLPESVTEIGENAFNFCTNLMCITFPANLKSIGDQAFANCTRLSEYFYKGTIAQWDNVSKGIFWNRYTNTYRITCVDGNKKLY